MLEKWKATLHAYQAGRKQKRIAKQQAKELARKKAERVLLGCLAVVLLSCSGGFTGIWMVAHPTPKPPPPATDYSQPAAPTTVVQQEEIVTSPWPGGMESSGGGSSYSDRVSVKGHYRNGKWIAPHTRKSPRSK